MKWHWRFNDDKNDLWMNLVIVKYRKTEEWCTDSANGVYGVSMWKYTRKLWDDSLIMFSKKLEIARELKCGREVLW